MALHLNEFKRAKVVFGCSLEHITFLREKMGRELGLGGRSSFGVILSHFFLLKDLTTWNRRFEEDKVRKLNPNLIFL